MRDPVHAVKGAEPRGLAAVVCVTLERLAISGALPPACCRRFVIHADSRRIFFVECNLAPPWPLRVLCMSAENEVEIMTYLKAGPHVVTLYGVCWDAPDRKPRLVMELCPHGNLKEHLKALPPGEVRYVVSSVCVCACRSWLW